MKGLGKFLLVCLSIALFAYFIIFITPAFFGVKVDFISGSDAAGEYSSGDLLYVTKTNAKDILLGETVVQQDSTGRQFYKITGKNKNSVSSALAEGQTLLFEGETEKVALRVPALGYGLFPFQSPGGIGIGVAIAAVLAGSGIALIRLGRKREKKKRASQRDVYSNREKYFE